MAKLPRVFLCLVLSGTLASAQQYVISTFAGGVPPPTPAIATSISIGVPEGVAVDEPGNVYFASQNCVFKIDRSGVLTLIAGNSRAGYSGDGGPATSAQLDGPSGVAVDNAGNLYIADWGNNRVRKVAPGGIITTLAQLGYPEGLAADSFGNVYATSYNSVFKVSPNGTTTLAAGANYSLYDVTYSGDGGPAIDAHLSGPQGLAVDDVDNLFIADSANNCIRKVDSSGIITTAAGTGGFNANSTLLEPIGVAAGPGGTLYIADLGNERIRQLGQDGVVTTVAGSGVEGFYGDGGSASSAQLNGPVSVTVDSTAKLYMADAGNYRIRSVTTDGIITTVAGNGMIDYLGDGGPATSAQVRPAAVTVDPSGNVYIADQGDSRIRKVSTNGTITTVASALPDFGRTFGIAGLAVGADGNAYFTEGYGISKATPNGIVTSVAGNGTYGYSGDGGPAAEAQLNFPVGLALDQSNALYIADSDNHRVRKVSSGGIITTVAGNGTYGDLGDRGQATTAELTYPLSVAIDSAGNLYIDDGYVREVSTDGLIATLSGDGAQGAIGANAIAVDAAENLYIAPPQTCDIRKISRAGIITKIAGNGACGYSGDGGPATAAQLSSTIVAVDSAGNLYVAEYNAVRVLRPTTEPQPVVNAITNGASNIAAPLAPGEIFVLYGEGMGPPQLATMQLNEAGLVDTTLAETQVLFNGTPAPMIYTSSNQLAAIVPYSVQPNELGTADMQVSYQGHTTNPMPVLIAASSPALFTLNATGQGQAAAVNQDGTINGPNNPASAGSYISLYATGEGATSPAGVDGKLATAPLPAPILPVNVTVGGQPATVQYAGAAPGEVAGVMQVNVQIPAGTASGNVPVVLTVGAAASQSGVTIAVSAN